MTLCITIVITMIIRTPLTLLGPSAAIAASMARVDEASSSTGGALCGDPEGKRFGAPTASTN